MGLATVILAMAISMDGWSFQVQSQTPSTFVVVPSVEPPPKPTPPPPVMDVYVVDMFTATWCGPCRNFKRTELPRLESMGIEVRQIDCSNGSPKGSNVSSLPTFKIRNTTTNEVIKTFVGAVSATTLKNAIPTTKKLSSVVISKGVASPEAVPYAKVTINGSHYPSESTVRNHLTYGHGVDTDGMSRADMIRLHDALHGY